VPIAILPPELASQIAAGEVVERPASIVKELLENSLDAGATRIDVRILAGGLEEIHIQDDGRGMDATDALLCLQRHATSKLQTLGDLETIASYGFRGEALPSIASVSKLDITTRPRDGDEGLLIRCDGAFVVETRPVGTGVGTGITVRDLFFNVPARRKFLRSTSTESSHIAEVLMDAALARPDVSLRLTRDGKPARNFEGVKNRAARVAQALEGERLHAISGERGPLSVDAFLSSPERARQGAGGLRLLLNGRPIKDRGLAGTIAHAYGSILERGRYPRGVIYLDLPGHLVDVNVHPQKLEVRFADPRAVSDAVYGIISRGLAGALAAGPAGRRAPEPSSETGPVFAAVGIPVARAVPGADATVRVVRDGPGPPSGRRYAAVLERLAGRSSHRSQQPGMFDADPSNTPLPVETGQDRSAWRNLRFIQQVRQTFLICEGEDGLYVLDQHAAAERVIFSRLRQSYQARTVATQALLFPLIVDVSVDEADLLEERAEQISSLGLDVRLRGREQASVHGVPRLLSAGSPERLLRDLLRELARTDDRAYSDTVDKVLATMACHSAVRAGDVLTAVEATGLLMDLDGADFAGYCPHGRPIVAVLGWQELERKVGRR
jgi:DNA mismatch repair protein MutL